MITKKDTVIQVIHRYPQTRLIFQKYGFCCKHCMSFQTDTIENRAIAHRVNVSQILAELQEVSQGKSQQQ